MKPSSKNSAASAAPGPGLPDLPDLPDLPGLPSLPGGAELDRMIDLTDPESIHNLSLPQLDNPLDQLEPTGSLEGDATQEAEAIRSALVERDAAYLEAKANLGKEDVKYRNKLDFLFNSGFYCTIVFLTNEQREAFLKAVGWTLGDAETVIYGGDLAKVMGIELPPCRYEFKLNRIDRRLNELT